MKRNSIVEIISLLFTALFLYTGISKLMEYYIFREQISLSPLLHPFAKEIAIFLPLLEVIVSVIVFIPRLRLTGLYSSLLLMVLFTGYVIYILLFNDHLPCTCGGIIQNLSWTQHLLLNVILIVMALTAIKLKKNQIKEVHA